MRAMRARVSRALASASRAHARAVDERHSSSSAAAAAAAAASSASSSSSSQHRSFRARKIVKGLNRVALFDVVRDVGKYCEFVPFCRASRVRNERERERGFANAERASGEEYFEADLEIGFAVFNEKYTSAVTCVKPHKVEARAIASGLFRSMRTTWTFTPLDGEGEGTSANVAASAIPGMDDGVIVDFEIDFEVKDAMHAAAVSVVFDDVAKSQIQAFEKRCKQLALAAASAKTRT